MEEGSGARPGASSGCSVLNSPIFRSLVGGECLQILRCGICMEFFNIPIVLPCGHTFCLQCLTEMCKHATRPRGQNTSATEVLIGCPNCRVQIFATPILQRNVTCNFIIQSLVDILRNRKVPATMDASLNTERSLVGPPVRAVTEEVLCGVLRDIDRLSASLQHRSVVDDAFFEIENIRHHHLSSQSSKAGGDSQNEPSKPGTSCSLHSSGGPCPCAPRNAVNPVLTSHPFKAINTDLVQHSPQLDASARNPRRNYASVVEAKNESPSKPTMATSNVRVDNAEDLLQFGSNSRRALTSSNNNSRNLSLSPAQPMASSSGFRNWNRNNSKSKDAHTANATLKTAVTQDSNDPRESRPFFKVGSKRLHHWKQDCMHMITCTPSPAKCQHADFCCHSAVKECCVAGQPNCFSYCNSPYSAHASPHVLATSDHNDMLLKKELKKRIRSRLDCSICSDCCMLLKKQGGKCRIVEGVLLLKATLLLADLLQWEKTFLQERELRDPGLCRQ